VDEGKFYEARQFKTWRLRTAWAGGDGFSSGIAYGFLTGMKPQDIVDFGAAHGRCCRRRGGTPSQLTLMK